MLGVSKAILRFSSEYPLSVKYAHKLLNRLDDDSSVVDIERCFQKAKKSLRKRRLRLLSSAKKLNKKSRLVLEEDLEEEVLEEEKLEDVMDEGLEEDVEEELEEEQLEEQLVQDVMDEELEEELVEDVMDEELEEDVMDEELEEELEEADVDVMEHSSHADSLLDFQADDMEWEDVAVDFGVLEREEQLRNEKVRKEFHNLIHRMEQSVLNFEQLCKVDLSKLGPLSPINIEEEIENGGKDDAIFVQIPAVEDDALHHVLLRHWTLVSGNALRALGWSLRKGCCDPLPGLQQTQYRKYLKLGALLEKHPLLLKQSVVTSIRGWCVNKFHGTSLTLLELFTDLLPLSSNFHSTKPTLFLDSFEVRVWNCGVLGRNEVRSLAPNVNRKTTKTIFNNDENDMKRRTRNCNDAECEPFKSFLVREGFDEAMLNDFTFLFSMAGCEEQMIHSDFDGEEYEKVLEEMDDPMKQPLSALFSIMHGTRLMVRPQTFESRNNLEAAQSLREIYLYPGEVLIFTGYLQHAGAEYKNSNIRVHCYIDCNNFKRKPFPDGDKSVGIINESDDE